MKDPECACFVDYREESENLTYDLAVSVAGSVEGRCAERGICREALPYVALTIVTMLLRGMAGLRSGDVLNCDGEFEEILNAVAEDVRRRDEILNAMLEKRGRRDQ